MTQIGRMRSKYICSDLMCCKNIDSCSMIALRISLIPTWCLGWGRGGEGEGMRTGVGGGEWMCAYHVAKQWKSRHIFIVLTSYSFLSMHGCN